MIRDLLIISSFFCISSTSLLAQTPTDTTLTVQDIEIRGKRFSGLSNGPVKLLTVSDNISSSSVTASEAVRQIPSVVTDIEGGVTFRGSNRPAMLINGIPYGLMEEYSGDMLIQLPAMFFNRIAVSSFTPADMIPDGDAGILNFASTYYNKEVSPLTVSLGGGLHNRYNAGAAVNLHPGKFHISAKYNYRREYRSRKFDKTTITPANKTVMNNNADARPDIHLADLFVGYDLSSNDIVSVYGMYYLMDYSRYGGINNSVFSPAGEKMKDILRHRYNDQRQEAASAEARWKHSFSDKASLNVVFNYNNFTYDEDNDYKNENKANGKIAAEDNLFILQKKNNFYWSAGYENHFSDDFSMKFGYIGRAKLENYDTQANNKSGDSWIENAQKTYNYDADRFLNLIYLGVEKEWNNLSVEAALQGEFSKLKVQDNTNNSFHLFSSAKIGYSFNDNNELMLRYQERVIRPYGSSLHSFIDYSDATHLLQGNPDLKDENIHSLELSYQINGTDFRVVPAVYFRHRNNRIMEVATQIEEETVWRKENIGNTQTLGFELAGNWSPFRFMTIGASGNAYRDEIDGRNVGFGETKSLWCWDAKGNVNFKITPTTELQIDGFYISDQLTAQGEIKSHYSVNAGLSQYFLNRHLRATLSVNNIFDSLEETTVINTEAMNMVQIRNRDARVAWLTLSYSL